MSIDCRMSDVVTTPSRRAALVAAGHWTEETLPSALVSHAKAKPDELAVVDSTDGRMISYGQLLADVGALAVRLLSLGVEPGMTVSVQLPNCYEAVVAELAVLYCGAVLNPLLPNYRANELEHILRLTEARVIITPAEYRGFDFVAMVDELRGEVPTVRAHLVVGGATGSVSVDSILRDGTDENFEPFLRAGDVSEVIFTSGTEATPKAVMHTEQTTNFAVRNMASWLQMGEDNRVWMPSPVGHSTGLNYGTRCALLLGMPLVLQDRWDGERAAELIQRYRLTFTMAATTFLADLVRAVERTDFDVSSMRLFTSGGAPVPSSLVHAADAYGVRVLRLYGATELLGTSWTRVDADDSKRFDTDGAIMDNVEVQVRRSDGTFADRGEPGELFVRSPNTAVGFFGDPERTLTTFLPDGWVRSGDLVTVDDEEYMTVVGRLKEIIIRGGLNIAPREIEDLLSGMPGIDEVAVIGLPDARLGELACACVVVADGCVAPELTDITAYLAEHSVAKYKYPERLLVVDALPKTPSGKVQKHLLEERFTEARA
jgi:acyl-CoA synthetase (AMP-forming)/AMP-acid ligase II